MNTTAETAETATPICEIPTGHPPGQRPWRRHWVDINLKDEWLEALNALTVLYLVSICEGHPPKNAQGDGTCPHVILRLWRTTHPARTQYFEHEAVALQHLLRGLPPRQGSYVRVTLSTVLTLSKNRALVGREVFVHFYGYGLRLSDATARDATAWFEGVIGDAQSIDAACHRLLTEGRTVKHYFAYGSNLCQRQMQDRCPGHRRVGSGVLKGYRWIITANGYASIVPSPADVVWGFVYELTEGHEQALDLYEGVAKGLYRKEMLTVVVNDKEHLCLVYVASTKEEGPPRPEYIATINQGIADTHLPQAYVQRYIRPVVPEGSGP